MRVFPIASYTPAEGLAAKVACTTQAPDLHDIVQHQESYLRVVKPHLLHEGLRPGTPEFMDLSVQYFNELIRNGFLVSQEEAIWLYRQELPDGTGFEGWVLGISALDYEENRIKRHENTIRDKEARLARHIGLLNSVAEPVLLAGSIPPNLEELALRTKNESPEIQFSDVLGRKHRLWKITNPAGIQQIRENFGAISALYIADGHHRSAATCLHIRSAGIDPQTNGIMALVMDKKMLQIKSFHRIIHVEAPAWKLEETCRMRGWKMQRILEIPEQLAKGNILAFSADGNYLLMPGQSRNQKNRASLLDVARLESEIFPTLFGIENSRADSRISFMRGDTSIEILQEILEKGKCGWIFMVAPNTMDDIIQVADAGDVMPPKSTWVEPKLMTGMLVMKFRIEGG